MTGKNILVTGGTGYIGSHAAVELAAAGYNPILVDNFSNSGPEVLDGLEKIIGIRPQFEKLDLLDLPALRDFSRRNPDIEAVIHFAAFKAVGESVVKPLAYYKNNLGSLINVIDVFGPNLNLVFSSSCTVYGQPDELPVTESAPFKKAESTYGNTKQQCEEILEFTSKAGNLKAISLRYFNPVGAHTSALIGELPNGTPNNLVPFITQTAIGKRELLTVFGSDYNTPDGSCVRDYIHVVDLAKAHVKAVDYLLNQKSGNLVDVFNLGTGYGSSVLEVIKTFEDSTGVKLNYSIGTRRPGDVEKVYGDTNKAKTQLKWESKLGLREMMVSAWNWEKHLASIKPTFKVL